MADIFISYASENKVQAQRLAQALEEQGWSVWWDRHIPPGMEYATVIENAVTSARCVVVLWSEYSVDSRWVKNEAAEGAERGILVPAFIEQVDLPFEFRRLQSADLTAWLTNIDNTGLNQLLSSIGRVLDSPSKPKSQPDRKPKSGSFGLPESWGSGSKLGYRLGSIAALVVGLNSCSDALAMGDDEMALGSLFFIGLAGYLYYRGKKL